MTEHRYSRLWVGLGIALLVVLVLGFLLPAIGRSHAKREWALRRARQGYLNLPLPPNCGKWGFIDKSGRFVIEAVYDRANEFSEGLAAVSIGGKYGYINKRGELVIKPRFDVAGAFSNGFAKVNIGAEIAGMGFIHGGVWFCIDRSGNRLPKDFSEDSRLPSEGLTAVKHGEQWGYMDADSKWIIPASFDRATDFSHGLAVVRLVGKRGECGMINAKGEFVIPPRFDWLSSFAEDLAAASSHGAYGFINRQGQWVIPPQFSNVREFFGGLATYETGRFSLWGVLDKTGKVLTPPRYPQSWGFSEGLAATMISEAIPNEGQHELLWGFIDSTGEFAIPPDFAWASPFSEGLAAVEVADPNAVHPLTRTIFMGRKELIQEALARVSNINDPKLDINPLVLAVTIGRVEAVKLLLAAGADANLKSWTSPSCTLLDLAEERGDKEIIQMLEAALANKPVAERRGHLWSLLMMEAENLQENGDYKRALPVAEKAVEQAEVSLDPHDPDLGGPLTVLGIVYSDLGRYTQAEALYKRALATDQKAPSYNTAIHLNNLADVYVAQGRYAEAEPLLKEAQTVIEKSGHGSEDPVLAAIILDTLATLYHDKGQNELAEPIAKRSLAIRERTAQPRDLAIGLNTLARIYLDMGRYAEAEPLYKRALEISEDSLGPDHPILADTLDGLAELYSRESLYAKAEPLFTRALSIREEALGPDHPDVGKTLDHLAALYRKTGRDKEAQEIEMRANRVRSTHSE